MEEHLIEELIDELKTLKLRESTVIEELEATCKRRAKQNHQSTRHETTQRSASRPLLEGERVIVTNRVKKPINWFGTARSKPQWTARNK